MTFTTRFAPSPTGPLHLGHAYSAMLAHDMAMAQGGDFLLRIEDIDRSRARPEWEQQIYVDLEWLGLSCGHPPMRQSDRLDAYRATLDQMWWDKFLYRCTCNRRDIAEAAAAPQEGAPLLGPDGVIYPGTCRNPISERDHSPAPCPTDAAIRLDMAAVPEGLTNEGQFTFSETGAEPTTVTFTLKEAIADIGDIVLARKDMGTSYHLSVVLDDAAQGITHVVRGQDLFEATKIHVILQCLLGLPTPIYHHHTLIRDDQGKRLAKRDDAQAISKYRADGYTPADIRKMVGLPN